jgi:hypothetical protein
VDEEDLRALLARDGVLLSGLEGQVERSTEGLARKLKFRQALSCARRD